MKTNRIFLFLLTLITSSLISMADSAQPDTLCIAGSAKEIMIFSNPSYTAIPVKGIDGGSENYYYQTGVSEDDEYSQSSYTKFRNPSDIRIIEIDRTKVSVSFSDSGNNPNLISFDIPDPDNRYVQSYTAPRKIDFGISLAHKGKSQWSLVSAGIGLGWVTPLNDKPSLPSSMGRSLEFTWTIVGGVQWSYGPHSISTGLGLAWRNYSLDKGRYFNREDNGVINIENYNPGYNKTSSRLQTFSLQIPFLYSLYFGHQRRFHLNAGPVVCFNTGAHISNGFSTYNQKTSVKTIGLNQTPVTMDILGGISYSSIGIYVRYSPMRVLKKSTGLDFNSFSTGIMLCF